MIPDRVAKWVAAECGAFTGLLQLAGDASTNNFYRLRAGGRSLVVLVCAEPDRLDTYLHMNSLFASSGLPVPAIHAFSRETGSLLMDDLGDIKLCDAAPANRQRLYANAVDLIAQLQRSVGTHRRAIETGRGTYEPPVLGRNRLLWELEYFAEHYLRGIQRAPETAISEVRRQFTHLADLLDIEPLVYCHRDYHSRNIMLTGGEIRLIDLQDARWGHRLYDLVSLLGDSYVDLEPELIESCKDRAFEAGAGLWTGRKEFERQYELMATQRNLKAIGTFGAQACLRGKREYLSFVPRTKKMLAGRLSHPDLAELRGTLDRCGFFEIGKG